MTALRAALQADLGVAQVRYAFHSSETNHSLAHQQAAIGDLFRAAYFDSNKVPGSGGLWECINLTTGTASSSPTAVSGQCVLQGTYGQFALKEARPNVAAMGVNTNNGSLQQGKFQVARDVVKAAEPNKRVLYGEGKYTVSAIIDLQYASCDFSHLQFVEQAGGFDGIMVQLGDPTNVFGLTEHNTQKVYVQGINQGPGSTTGPGGTAGYDFQGAPGQATGTGNVPSLATGVSVLEADSMHDIEVSVSRCLIGVQYWGNTEKQHITVRAAYCGIAVKEVGPSTSPSNSGTPDTNRIRLIGNVCKQWYVSGDDTSCCLDINAESRIDDGSTFPAAYNNSILIPTPAMKWSNGKRQKVQGEMRAHNGRLIMYIDRDSSTNLSDQGSDTLTVNGLSTTHTYGTVLMADRIAHLDGSGIFIKDNGPARSNFSTTDALDCAAVQLNRIDKACPLPFHLEEIYCARGVNIGDATKGLYPTDIDFAGGFSIEMNGGTYAFVVEKATRCRFPIKHCVGNIQLQAGCSDCQIETSVDFIKRGHTITKDPAATCMVHFTGRIASTALTGLSWLFDGMSVEALSDYGNRPAVYDGSSWKVATFGVL